MMRTAYAIAFRGDRFLMVRNNARGGWEMPGGHVEAGESPEDAVTREFIEESGYSIRIVGRMAYRGVDVFAAILGEKVSEDCEMESALFSRIPDDLSFDRAEYEVTVRWAATAVGSANGPDAVRRSRISWGVRSRDFGSMRSAFHSIPAR